MKNEQTPLYRCPTGTENRIYNVHNRNGKKDGASHIDVFIPSLAPGERMVLAEIDGPAVIDRLWLSLNWPGKALYADSMLRNRAVIMECFWDDADMPAISAPIGDFFCHILGYDKPFENAFFADPAGRSLLSFIPMPFRKNARIELYNGFDKPVQIYHAVSVSKGVELTEEDSYLHAYWQRSAPVPPGNTHPVLPQVSGNGKYLGTHIGILSDPQNPFSWHGSFLNIYLGGDPDKPDFITPSLDDYTGSSWDYDACFTHQDSGLLHSIRFPDGAGHHALYCYHRRDPMHFKDFCRVEFQPGGGEMASRLIEEIDKNPQLMDRIHLYTSLSELRKQLEAGKNIWSKISRSDDVSTVALYYLDKPDGTGSMLDDLDTARQPHWNWPTHS